MKKKVKRATTSKKTSRTFSWENDFIIIAGGGFLVIVFIALFLFR